jgi:putative ABC transport system permease protein
MRALNLKLWRDLYHLRGQALAISLVIASGVMTFIVFQGSLAALTLTKDRFYQDQQFAEVFANAKRAPESLRLRAEGISGVNVAETRVVTMAHLEVPGFDEPVRGALQSLPDGRQPSLNRLYLRTGSLPDPAHDDEVVISDGLAEAHGLQPGDTIEAVINGRYHRLRVSGVALSPEFVYQIGPADILPDYKRYGVLWMNRRGLANAMGMDGAFNNLVLTLQAGASAERVIEELDLLLEPYGGTGAHDRMEQMSHRFLMEELNGLEGMARIIPVIFLGIAAFLLNVVVTRTIRTQRTQIAVLKAFGYGNGHLLWHYIAMTGVIVLAGALVGVALGSWAANGMAQIYAEFFRFPELIFRLDPRVATTAVGVAALAAFLGTFNAVRAAVSLKPAEAMRPPAPAGFRQSFIDRGWLGRTLTQGPRMILRNLARYPVKAGLSVVGIAMAVSLLMLGSYQHTAVRYMIDIQYRLVQRMDLGVSFVEPTSARAAGELMAIDGVNHVETYRAVPVRLRHGTRQYLTTLQGLPREGELRRVLGDRLQSVPLPESGIMLTDYLAQYLGVEPGDTLQVEIMEGQRRTVDVPLAGTVRELVGVGAYMERRQLNRLMGEGEAISGAWLLVDRHRQADVHAALRDVPRIAGVGIIAEAGKRLQEHLDESMLMVIGIMMTLSGVVAFAVVYNNARIAFAERARELATFRILGFTRNEVARLLVGETGILTLMALPLGWILGVGFCLLINQAFSTDLFRIPFILTPQSLAFSALGVLLATGISMMLIVRRLGRLDMVSALKDIE